MKPLKAFTIMELTVAMLIASLCFAIVFKAFNTLSGTLYSASEKNKHISSFVLADKLLRKDFSEQGMHIFRSDNGLKFRSKSREINYVFTDDYILRHQDNADQDTFQMPVRHVSYSFEFDEPAVGELIDEIVLQTGIQDRMINLNYLKKYSSDELFNK